MDLKLIVSHLKKYPENNFTKEVIIPLLEKMGYLKVEFFGGQSEEGKDIVIWDKDRFGDLKLLVAQVKHFKFTNKASDSKSLQTVINQLTACLTRKLVYTDKNAYYPTEVLLISTYPIDTKSILSRFSTELYLKDQNIKIIDGNKLGELILKHTPEVIKKIIGNEFEISYKLKPQFNNDILLKALGRKSTKDIKKIYSDIDFSIGKITTSLFFNASFESREEDIELTVEENLFFKLLCKDFSQPLAFINNDFQSYNENISYLNKNVEEKINIEEEETNILNSSINSLQHDRNEQMKVLTQLSNEKEKYRHKQFTDKRNEIEFQETSAEKKLSKLKKEIKQREDELIVKRKKLVELRTQKESLRFKYHLDGYILANEIKSKRKWIVSVVKEFNKSKPRTEELREFLQKCQAILRFATVVLDIKNQKFFSCIGINRSNNIKDGYSSTRLKLSIDQIFDTGMNLFVLGNAGAGKSTSIEMYGWNRQNSDRLIIFIPLGQLTQTYSSNIERSEKLKDISLELLLADYLTKKGIQVTFQELISVIEEKKVVLLLDGLDEAIKSASYLPVEIKNMAAKYPNIQIILTSRMYGPYIDEVPFFAVTLLPFTVEQRNLFIKKWFEDEGATDSTYQRILKHIENSKAIGDIVKTPLLATILCVLAEYNLPLPKTEIKLYDERLMLLTGYYDNVKHIVTRISSTPSSLENIAQKIAFYLHCKNLREESLEAIKERMEKLLGNHFNKLEIDIAVEELISPCEILVPMTNDGKYGFGHLRYQEHLAARELSNRSIDLIPLLSQSWWQGAIVLFARMNDNIEWLIRLIGEGGKIFLPVVANIINTRSKHERENLNSLVEKYILIKTGDYDQIKREMNPLHPDFEDSEVYYFNSYEY